ncbi:hypothetical protein [Rhizobium wuzhouense]|uniref:Uncharacterized protein n=1 Tax=Rhizobium wuzhouense TaxID=1986026 RepID=A0ABX5NW45_9HYPH|nr:hypothetical protein [Rhizobium wuzhouense]PYB73987.1 hypothetical protein DMY87_09720 [Rhizobium wuzhouense]
MAHLENADGQGQLLIGERLSPVSYRVVAEEADGGLAVRVDLQAPRDWLIKQGFKRRATLVLASGDRVEVVHEDEVDVSDSLAIVLKTERLVYDGGKALLEAFPELRSEDAGEKQPGNASL